MVELKENNNVIQFPKDHSTKVRVRESKQNRRTTVVFSVVTLLMVSFLANQWIAKSQIGETFSGTRGVASIHPQDSAKDINWESDVAKNLSKDSLNAKDTMGVKPSVREEMIFGFLEGKYGVRLAQGRVESLEFINSMNDQPVKIKAKDEFLLTYKEIFLGSYTKVIKDESNNNKEIFKLMNDGNVIVGKAEFSLNDEGQVLNIKITGN